MSRTRRSSAAQLASRCGCSSALVGRRKRPAHPPHLPALFMLFIFGWETLWLHAARNGGLTRLPDRPGTTGATAGRSDRLRRRDFLLCTARLCSSGRFHRAGHLHRCVRGDGSDFAVAVVAIAALVISSPPRRAAEPGESPPRAGPPSQLSRTSILMTALFYGWGAGLFASSAGSNYGWWCWRCGRLCCSGRSPGSSASNTAVRMAVAHSGAVALAAAPQARGRLERLQGRHARPVRHPPRLTGCSRRWTPDQVRGDDSASP